MSGADQWILTQAEYDDLAKLKADKGSTWDDELSKRSQAAVLISKIGTKLKLPQSSVATATILMHRFYIRESFAKFSYQELCQAAVFVASKVDEHPRKIKDVIHAGLCVRFNTDDISGSVSFAEDSSEYGRLKERLLTLEKILLQTCCFDLTIKHPYNYVLRNIKFLNNSDIEEELLQGAWKIITDSLKTTICIRFPPKTVAVAAIYVAASQSSIDIAQTVGKPGFDPVDLEIFPDAPASTVRQIMESFNI